MFHPVPRGSLLSKIAGSELGSSVLLSLSCPNIRMFLATDIQQQPRCPGLCLRHTVLGTDLFYILSILNLKVSQTHSQSFYQRVSELIFIEWTRNRDVQSDVAGWCPYHREFGVLLLKDNQGSP